MLAEEAVKVVRRGKAAFRGDLRHLEVGGLQQIAGSLKAEFIAERDKGLTAGLSHYVRGTGYRKAEMTGERGKIGITGEALLEEADDGLLPVVRRGLFCKPGGTEQLEKISLDHRREAQ